ncbi:hypothetical protein VTN77DRAFT_7508 [Rasamsonia byssochlamydoides]|uniref:uncharacterized protein n=1 Tax=Rasamsonia byssochlamydoides TaxID=89139 RepID=UPI0037438C79
MRFLWLWMFEDWATRRLLASPLFHRMVGKIHKGIHRLRYGPPPEEMGGTKIDDHSGIRYFLRLFMEEVKEQLKDKPRR